MSNPIKRLEIIKNAIELEDADIIASQLPHLKNDARDSALLAIALALEEQRYGEAMADIIAWLQHQRAMVHWQDPRIAASKLELKTLEEQLCALLDTRNARITRLDAFNDLYMSRLGPLMTEVLRLRKVLAEATLRRQEAQRRTGRDEPAIDPVRDDAREQYETWREQQQKAQQRRDLQENMPPADRQELKRLWRQASKLCHPDLVDEALKTQANDMMVQLNQARQRGDLTTIRSLLARLMRGQQPLAAHDTLNDLTLLQRKMTAIKQQIAELLQELRTLERERAWLLISSLSDPEAYFRQQEKALANTIATLQKHITESGFDEVA